MSKIEEAREILRSLGLPRAQQNEMSALTLLALCGLRPNDQWRKARRHSVTVTKGIMSFIAQEYGKQYAPNTRETFRRQVLHQFVQAHIADYNPDAPDLPTNSPRAHYAITETALAVVRAYGTRRWRSAVSQFLSSQGSLLTVYQRNREQRLVPAILPDGTTLKLSPGKHNQLQAAVLAEFAPRFAPGALLVYFGDTAKKNLYVNAERLKTLRVYVSAFPDLAEFRRHLKQIAWETEVWIAEMPEHLIHFNGDRFLGPR
jgi:hypothetical protein